MLPIGISIQRLRDADSSIMVDVVETKIGSPLKANAKIVAGNEKKKLLEPNSQEKKLRKRDPQKHPGKPADHQRMEGKRRAVCCLTSQEIVVNSTEDFITTEAMEFAVNSFTLAVMAMKITLKHRKNAKVFAMMLSVFAI